MVVEIYTSSFCGYCILAKKILTQKNISFVETNLTFEPNKRTQMNKRCPGKTSVPQIFISDIHIGGYDELYILEINGKLDSLISESKW